MNKNYFAHSDTDCVQYILHGIKVYFKDQWSVVNFHNYLHVKKKAIDR